jgi:hypothetical protein
MKIIISLDYEIYFKKNDVNSNNQLINNTNKLISLLEKNNIKSTFFVDAGYLHALDRQRYRYTNLKDDYLNIIHQIMQLEKTNNEIGLHIHPHWEDTYFFNGKWEMQLDRYKLSDYKQKDVEIIFNKYYNQLQKIVKNDIISYRAGGWCIEPFSLIKNHLKNNGIKLEATVFRGGYCSTKTHSYDFRGYPKKEFWRFSDTPKKEDHNGPFLEIPSTTSYIPNYQYWKIAIDKIFKINGGNQNGEGIKPGLKEIARRIIVGNTVPVSLDRFKSAVLLKTFKENEKSNNSYFSIIGHPKSIDENSLKDLKHFIEYALGNGHTFTTYSEEFNKLF